MNLTTQSSETYTHLSNMSSDISYGMSVVTPYRLKNGKMSPHMAHYNQKGIYVGSSKIHGREPLPLDENGHLPKIHKKEKQVEKTVESSENKTDAKPESDTSSDDFEMVNVPETDEETRNKKMPKYTTVKVYFLKNGTKSPHLAHYNDEGKYVGSLKFILVVSQYYWMIMVK